MAKTGTHPSPILHHGNGSQDVLWKALVANGGELFAALEAVKGQVGIQKGRAVGLCLRYSRITDEGMEALAGLTDVTEFESSERMTDAALVHLGGMTKME